jgi:hypothetical protein
VSELGDLFDVSAGSAESVKNSLEVSTLLHRDDSQLIFFIDPNQEGLVVIVENTTAIWPISVQTTSFKESISLLEKEVVIDKLGLNFFAHTLKRIESTLEVPIQS